MVYTNPFTLQQDMQPSISISLPAGRQSNESLGYEDILALVFGDISLTVLTDPDKPARSSFTDQILLLYLAGNLTLDGRL